MTDPHSTSSTDDCRIIELPRVRHANGSLTVADNIDQAMPFKTRRVFYIYDVPADADRGGHSHYSDLALIIALTGSFDVTVDDGKSKKTITLNRPYKALYVPAGIWSTLSEFSGGAVCMVLTSQRYSEDDYVRDYDEFLRLTAPKRKL
ncbi:MAG: FdtA/QdtA family cupin domain-containing protein [Bacteroidales bacterium]|nr:FdtA/QdtA family cupin domain-containing protein [Bacteroidales bacterium]